MNNTQVLSNDFIIQYINTNLTDEKKAIIPYIDVVLKVNEQLNDDIISDFRNSSVFYDDLHNLDFYEVLDNWFMNDLDVEGNNKQITLFLVHMYN